MSAENNPSPFGSMRRHWWREPKEDVHQALFATLRAIDQEQQVRLSNNRVTKRLYGDEVRPYTYLTSPGTPLINPVLSPGAQRNAWGSITYNLCRVAVDALTSKLAKHKPKPAFITDNGTWAQRRRARRLDEFVYGTFHATKLFDSGRRAFLDGSSRDIGVVKGYLRDGKVCLERVQPEEILVGALDSLYNRPRSKYHVTLVARDEALEWVEEWHREKSKAQKEELRKAIREATSGLSTDAHWAALASQGDVVMIAEGWHLPSKRDGSDGRHVIAVNTSTLLDEGWKIPRFPFANFRFHERDSGYYGQGVVELLMSRQLALNSLCRTITDALRLMSVPRYFVKRGQAEAFDVRQLTNEVGVIMEGLEPPQVLTGNVIPPELFTTYQQAIREGLEQVGISQLSVAGVKPAGLNSAPALREQTDIESDRFSLVTLQYEAMYMEAGQLVVDLATMAKEQGVKLKATSETRGTMREIDWREAALDSDSYVLKMHSASQLPQTPAARKDFIRELFQDQLIDQLEYRRLMDLPDLDASFSLAMAGRDDIEYVVEKFLDGDDDKGVEELYEPPERFQDLKYGVKRMQLEYLRAKRLGAPPGRLELLLRWAEQALDILSQQEAPPPAPPQAGGAPPPPGAGTSLPPGAAPPLPAAA